VDAKHRCTVANDMFKDPRLVSNNFNAGTDDYAFAVLLYKSLTRLHPFAGVIKSNLNINTMDRMRDKLSVFSVKDIVIPPMVDKDVFLSTRLKDDLMSIFVDDERLLIDASLDDFKENLTMCDNHNDYYYSRYNRCPVCEIDAQEMVPIIKIGTVGGIPIRLVFTDPSVKIIFNENTYLNDQKYIVFRNSRARTTVEPGSMYYVNNAGDVFYKVDKEVIKIKTKEKVFEIPKLFNSRTMVLDNDVFFVSKGLNLTKFSLFGSDESFEERVTTVSINNVFEVIDAKTYFVCNMYDNKKIIDISGYNYQLDNTDKIVGYGIHYDEVTKKWLFIFENPKGDFFTYIFDKTKGIVYSNDKVRYIGKLCNLCFYGNIIFKPADKKIVGFNYEKNQYKEFEVPVINEGTNLIKRDKKFIAINEKEIYEIG
jgi:hypothetical protein